jgi:hypothetical protein
LGATVYHEAARRSSARRYNLERLDWVLQLEAGGGE